MNSFKFVLILVLVLPMQLAAQEVILQKLPEPIKGFGFRGTTSIYNGAGLGSDYPARIDMLEVKDGIITRNDLHITKYDFTGTKLWEGDISKYFGLQDRPTMSIVSDSKATYIFELKTNMVKAKEARVIHITPEGVFTEYKIETDIKLFVGTIDFLGIDEFIANGELKILAKSKNVENGRVPYRLYTMDLKAGKLVSKDISLPTDAYEADHVRSEPYGKTQFMWDYTGRLGDHFIFFKSYLKDVKKSKQKTVITQVLEMTNEGIVVSEKDIDFQPYLADDDREFISPSLFWNEFDNSISVLGMMEIDKKKINGLYLLKYDYTTGSLTYKHEHHFNQILKPEIKPTITAHYVIPESVREAHSLNLSSTDVFITPQNKFIDIRIITNFDRNEMDFFEVKFDQYGDHVQTSIVKFGAYISGLGAVIPQPEEYHILWKDTVRHHYVKSGPSAMDFVHQTGTKGKSESNYYIPLKSVNKIVKYDQDKGVFSLITN